MKLSTIQLQILEMIGRSKEKGFFQHELAKECGLEPKYLHHHIRTIEKFQLLYPFL